MRKIGAVSLNLLLTLAFLSGQRAAAAVVTVAPTPPPDRQVTYAYKTFLAPDRIGGGLLGNLNEDFGTLTLTFYPSKIIQGTYRPEYGNFTPVTGGMLDSGHFWLDFGISGRIHFGGHFTKHGIVGTAQSWSNPLATWRLHGQFQHA
jgi:hypothetical protein